MRGIEDCCRNCTERYLGCHSYCEKYLDANEKWEEQKKQIRSYQMDEYDNYKCEAIKKEQRRRKHGK